MPDEFSHGHLTYHASQVAALEPQELQKVWADGFLAFSATERRWKKEDTAEQVQAWLGEAEQKINGDDKIGFLNEVNLWRTEEGAIEELAIERTDDGYYVQSWKLEPPADDKPANCCYRTVTVYPGKSKHTPFTEKTLQATEVIWYDMRLHFFLSTAFPTMKG